MASYSSSWPTQTLKPSERYVLAKNHSSVEVLGAEQESLGDQLQHTKQLLKSIKSKMSSSSSSSGSRNRGGEVDGDVHNVLALTRVKGQSLEKYNRTPAKHKVNTTRILNENFLKKESEPSVVPRGSSVMRIRNDETLRQVGRLSMQDMLSHSPTMMAKKKKADGILAEQARHKKDRIVFVSGSGYVYKHVPPKCV